MTPPDRTRIRWRAARRWLRARLSLLPLVALLAVTLPHLADGDWMRSDSGWYAAIGVQAWRTGELLTLGAEPGVPYFNKPPLVFWIIGLPMHLLGPNAWTARLGTIAAAGICVLLTVSIARTGLSRRGALWAGLSLSLTYEFFRRTREISLDMWQAAFLLIALRVLLGAITADHRRRAVAAMAITGVPIGLALLCKPLVGLAALPMFAIMLLLCRKCRLIPWLLLTLASALLVAAPWHLAMQAIHGEAFVGQYFGTEIADRASGGSVVNEGGVGRWWFYIEKVLAGYWPWLIPIACCIGATIRRRRIGGDARLLICAAIWTVAWLVLLSIFPDRRDRYALVLYPTLAIPVGAWLACRSRPAIRSLLKGVERHGIWAMPMAACILAILPIRVQSPPDPQWTELFAYLESEGNPDVWQGAMIGHRGSRIYLETGKWPATTRNREGDIIVSPPGGALIIYHDHDGLKPGPGEHVVFRARMLTLTRLAQGAAWTPIPTGS